MVTIALQLPAKTLAWGCTFLLTSLSQAQTAPTPAAPGDPAPTQRVEITGSAIKRIDAEKAVPATVLRLEGLKRAGITSVEQLMQLLSPNNSLTTTSHVAAVYAELSLPLLPTLEAALALRHDRYSDFGGSSNPKVSPSPTLRSTLTASCATLTARWPTS